MKKCGLWMILLATLFFSFQSGIVKVEASQTTEVMDINNEEKIAVYFYSPLCTTCQAVKPFIEQLKLEGINVIEYSMLEDENIQLLEDYKATYFVPKKSGTVPIVFVGSTFFHGLDVIDGVESGKIQSLSSEPLRDIQDAESINLKGFVGFVTVLAAGLLDGFNPCAIAMLLLFISLLGFTSSRKILVMVSFTYITALFLTYLALGTVMFQFLYLIQDEIAIVTRIISYFIIVMALFLFFFNMYDFIVSRKQDYGKVKNQLPRGIQKMNKRIIRFFTSRLTDQDGNPKSLFPILGFTFLLGMIISLTEFMCTGQIYLPIVLALVQYSDTLNLGAIIYLIVYNLMFVMPLIVISLIAIKSKSVMSTSNFIREKLHIIKLLNALLFLTIAMYYILKVFKIIG